MADRAQKLRVTADAGEWSATHDGMGVSSYQAIQDEAGKVVALVVAQSDDYMADPDPEPYSRLFSASPEMLVALQAAGEEVSRLAAFLVGYGDAADLAAKKLRALQPIIAAAIFKATGSPS